ncbi:MAG: hypothetical protein K0R28_1002 [Paenibacillus sp.]|jgi:hypothetical protein|nr:hypothetical protein [Paenibacillus sp.]
MADLTISLVGLTASGAYHYSKGQAKSGVRTMQYEIARTPEGSTSPNGKGK